MGPAPCNGRRRSLFHGARGSLEETRYHLLLAKDLGFLKEDGYNALETEYKILSKMLNRLIQSLKARRVEK